MQTETGQRSERTEALFTNESKGTGLINFERIAGMLGLLVPLTLPLGAGAQQQPNAPLPDIRQLLNEVQAHQKQLEKVRENYTYSSLQTTQDIDSNGQVKKTESREFEQFYANGHPIGRAVKRSE